MIQLQAWHSFISQIIGVGAAIFLLGGLWTPVVGTLVAILILWIAFSHCGGPWIPIMVTALGAAMAMVGLGAWSLDARLYGRKRIYIPEL